MFANLLLENYFLPEISVRISSDYDPKTENQVAEIGLGRSIRGNREDSSKYMVELEVKVSPGLGNKKKQCPIIADATVRGYFRFDKLPAEENEIAKYLMLNGAAILYGLVRAHVAQLTALSPYGRFILPPVNFLKIFPQEARMQDKPELRRKS